MTALAATATAASEEKLEHAPNILVIIADDLGIGDLSHNSSPIRTP
ncbi:MAG: hypothetical protein AAGA95_06180 [Pseudomonadota bacterium]